MPVCVVTIAAASVVALSGSTTPCEVTETSILRPDSLVEDDRFGRDLAFDSHWGMIGGYQKVFVHQINAGHWTEVAVLTEEGSGGRYGEVIALDGDVLVVADGTTDENTRALVYRYDGKDWLKEAELLPSDGVTGNGNYGGALAASGDVVAIARRDDNVPPTPGAVYVSRFDGIHWQEETVLRPTDTEERIRYGEGVAIDGNRIAVGAPGAEGSAESTGGVVYVYEFDGEGWGNELRVFAAESAENDFFGRNVHLHGDVLVVSAFQHAFDASHDYSGAVFVFRHDGVQWQESAELFGYDVEAAHHFGEEMSVDDDRLAVSGRLEGSEFRFVQYMQFDGDQWNAEAVLRSSEAAINDQFGRSGLAVHDDAIVVGAESSDVWANNAGSVYFFRGLGDCNNNDVIDLCEMDDDPSLDRNGNGVLDVCECPAADLSGDQVVGPADLAVVLGNWGPVPPNDPIADINGDGVVGAADLALVLGNWGPCD